MSGATTLRPTDEALLRVTTLDESDRPVRLLTDDWKLVDELDVAVERARSPLRRASITARLGDAAVILMALAACIIVGISAVPNPAKRPIIVAVFVLAAGIELVRLEYPGYHNKRARMRGPSNARPVYFAGGSPYSRRRLVLGRRCLFLISEDGRISQLPWSDISVVGLDFRMSGAVMVMAVDGRFLPLATSGRVGGALSLVWGGNWWGRHEQFRTSLKDDLERTGVPVAVIDWSAVAI
ncbi:hypothetical protein ACF1AJ_16165 [Leifsonia sp. NPDC014704]|uniref:hypothetical protein n=1 Tax=Leifsonia sp. NPDC014704 TaxID=3364123 RepID=UPI0036F47971